MVDENPIYEIYKAIDFEQISSWEELCVQAAISGIDIGKDLFWAMTAAGSYLKGCYLATIDSISNDSSVYDYICGFEYMDQLYCCYPDVRKAQNVLTTYDTDERFCNAVISAHDRIWKTMSRESFIGQRKSFLFKCMAFRCPFTLMQWYDMRKNALHRYYPEFVRLIASYLKLVDPKFSNMKNVSEAWKTAYTAFSYTVSRQNDKSKFMI